MGLNILLFTYTPKSNSLIMYCWVYFTPCVMFIAIAIALAIDIATYHHILVHHEKLVTLNIYDSKLISSSNAHSKQSFLKANTARSLSPSLPYPFRIPLQSTTQMVLTWIFFQFAQMCQPPKYGICFPWHLKKAANCGWVDTWDHIAKASWHLNFNYMLKLTSQNEACFLTI